MSVQGLSEQGTGKASTVITESAFAPQRPEDFCKICWLIAEGMHVSAFLSKLVSGLLAASVSPWSWSGEPCPGLVTRPEPRQEPWNIKWAQELAREVREADAGKAGFWTSFGRIFPSLIWVGRKSTIIYNLIISSAKAPKIAKLFEAQGLQLIFYGDSITEQWRGTDQGG